MTREHKLALIVGFSLFLVLGVLISDHFSKARQVELAENIQPSSPRQMGGAVAPGLRDDKSLAAPTPGNSLASPTPQRRDLVPLPPGPSFSTPPAAPPQTIAMGGPRVPFTPLVDVNNHGAGDVAPHTPFDDARHPGETSGPPVVQIPVQKYEVKEGDNLYRITTKYYGDAKLCDKLREYNKLGSGSTIHEGGTVLIPPKEVLLGKPYIPPTGSATPGITMGVRGASADPTLAKPADGFREYVVKSGDTLMGISRKMLGSDARYTEIEDANSGVDAESLKVGAKLRIPAK